VITQPYRSIFLTDSGRELADSCAKRHAVVRDFLIAIGVDAEIAEADAEGLEHHVSRETLDAFKNVIKKGIRA
jgi:DtxR family manganese transport transcriptional regulator